MSERHDIEAMGFVVGAGSSDPARDAERARAAIEERRRLERDARDAVAGMPAQVGMPAPPRPPKEPVMAKSAREGVQADFGIETTARSGAVSWSGAADPTEWDVLAAWSSKPSAAIYHANRAYEGWNASSRVPLAAELLGNLRQITISAPVSRMIDEISTIDAQRYPEEIYHHEMGRSAEPAGDHVLPGGRAAMRYMRRERELRATGARPGSFIRRTVRANLAGIKALMACRGELAVPRGAAGEADPLDILRGDMRRLRDRLADEGLTDQMIDGWDYQQLWSYHERVYAAGRWDGLTRIGGGVVRWGRAMGRPDDVAMYPCPKYQFDGRLLACAHAEGTWVSPDPTRFFEGEWPAYYTIWNGKHAPLETGLFDIHFIRPAGGDDRWYLDVLRWS